MLNEYEGLKINGLNDKQLKAFVSSINHYKYFHKLGKHLSHLYRLTRNNSSWKVTSYEYKQNKLQANKTYLISNNDIVFHLKTLGMFAFNY